MSRPSLTPHLVLFVCGLALAGCGGSEPPASSGAALGPAAEPGEPPGTTRATTEGRVHEGASVSDDEVRATVPVDLEPSATPLLALRQLGSARAEDGRGAQVSSERAIAFDVDADRFPPRALDPILFVGELAFHHYEYPEPGVLRFVADGGALTEGAVVTLGYYVGDENSVVLHSALDLSEAR